jgi:hypothetical protein
VGKRGADYDISHAYFDGFGWGHAGLVGAGLGADLLPGAGLLPGDATMITSPS